LLKREVF
jgi:hypothetical protein